jgi:tetratricopeptide (TPR) repeat protein
VRRWSKAVPEDAPGYAGMLAYHYGMGRAVDRAETFLFRAGAEAARAAAPSEALHFFEEASKLYLQLHQGGGDPAKRAVLEKNIAQALYYRGRFLEAIDHFNLALRLLGDRVVERRLELGLRFVGNMTTVFVRLYGPGVNRFGPAGDLPPAIMDRATLAQRRRHQPASATFDSMDSRLPAASTDVIPLAKVRRWGALFAFGGSPASRTVGAGARARATRSVDEYLYERHELHLPRARG